MEREQVRFYISQSIEELKEALQLLDEPSEHIDQALSVKLSTSLNYLYGAWTLRHVAPGKVAQMSQVEYETAIFSAPSDLVPRFDDRES